MTITNGDKSNNSRGRKILWVSSTILDVHFHKISLLETLKHLEKRGDNITLIAMRSKNVFPNEDSQVRIISVPLRYVPVVSPVIYIMLLTFFLPAYIVISKPDFIITEPDFSSLGSISALPFAKLRGAKFIMDIRSTPVETFGFRGFLQNSFFAVSVFVAKTFFDGMTIITDPMKRELCDKFGLDSDRMGVWSSGVSVQSFDPRNYVSERAILRHRLGLENKFTVLYHGSFRSTGGLTETIEAISLVRQVYPDVTLFLLGKGNIPDLKELIAKNETRNNVIIHDPVDYAEVPKYIAMCDVGIVPLPNIPYWRYQCPLKLLEYLAMGKPVIMTDILAHRLIVGDQKCGIYISNVTPREIAESIVYAYHNREKLAQWGAIGRKIVSDKYRWDRVVADLERCLLSIETRPN